MNFSGFSIVVGLMLAAGPHAFSQEPTTSPGLDANASAPLQSGSAPTDQPELYDPRRDGLSIFEDAHELYQLVVMDGRCPIKKTEAKRIPCAFLFYQRVGDTDGSLRLARPIFRVDSEKKIYSLLDRVFVKASAQHLWRTTPSVKGEADKAEYLAIAIVGHDENEANCAKGNPCIRQSLFYEFTKSGELGKFPKAFLDEVWGPRRMIDQALRRPGG